MDFYTIPAPVHVWTFNKNEGEFHTLKCSFNSILPPNRTSGWWDEGTLQPSYGCICITKCPGASLHARCQIRWENRTGQAK